MSSVLNVLVYDAVGAKGCIGCVKAMVKTRGTGMQQSGFCQVFNHLSWEKMFWMIFNRLAVRLQHVSSLSKGSVWDVEVPDQFSCAGRHQGKVYFLEFYPHLSMPFSLCYLLKASLGGVHVLYGHPSVPQ